MNFSTSTPDIMYPLDTGVCLIVIPPGLQTLSLLLILLILLILNTLLFFKYIIRRD